MHICIGKSCRAILIVEWPRLLEVCIKGRFGFHVYISHYLDVRWYLNSRFGGWTGNWTVEDRRLHWWGSWRDLHRRHCRLCRTGVPCGTLSSV